jgi:RNA polymerase sigma factor (sigma-70 family)
MRLARLGNTGAFEALVRRYQGTLRRHCQRVLSPSLAEDVTQQAFLQLWGALEKEDEIRDVRAWLYRVAHNAAVNVVRRGGYRYEHLEESLHDGAEPHAIVELDLRLRETLVGIAALPDRQRDALVWTAVEGVSRSAVAQEMGVTEGAVAQLIHRERSRRVRSRRGPDW